MPSSPVQHEPIDLPGTLRLLEDNLVAQQICVLRCTFSHILSFVGWFIKISRTRLKVNRRSNSLSKPPRRQEPRPLKILCASSPSSLFHLPNFIKQLPQTHTQIDRRFSTAIMSMHQTDRFLRSCHLAQHLAQQGKQHIYVFVYDHHYFSPEFQASFPTGRLVGLGFLPNWTWHVNHQGMSDPLAP